MGNSGLEIQNVTLWLWKCAFIVGNRVMWIFVPARRGRDGFVVSFFYNLFSQHSLDVASCIWRNRRYVPSKRLSHRLCLLIQRNLVIWMSSALSVLRNTFPFKSHFRFSGIVEVNGNPCIKVEFELFDEYAFMDQNSMCWSRRKRPVLWADLLANRLLCVRAGFANRSTAVLKKESLL